MIGTTLGLPAKPLDSPGTQSANHNEYNSKAQIRHTLSELHESKGSSLYLPGPLSPNLPGLCSSGQQTNS